MRFKLAVVALLSCGLAVVGVDYMHNEARAQAAGGADVVTAGAADAVPTPETVTLDAGPLVVADAPAAPAVGSGSAVTPPAPPPVVTAPPTPADQLHDPTTHPMETISDVKAAKRYGWAAVVFAVVTILARLAGKLGHAVKWLAWLNQGIASVVVGAAAAIGTAAYNALAMGGSLLAAILAAAVALATLWNPTTPKTEPAK